MYLVLVLVINLCLLTQSKMVSKVYLNYRPVEYYSTSFEILTTIVVLENEPFQLVLKNYCAVSAICSNRLEDYPFTVTIKRSQESDGNWTTFLDVSEATDDMSTHWECIVNKKNYQSNNMIKEQSIKFRIHVRGSKKVNVSIGKDLASQTTDLKIIDYDAIIQYWYEEGEWVDMDCSVPYSEGRLQLNYYNSQNKKLVQTGLIPDKLNFRKSMAKEDSGEYIDCTYLCNGIAYTYRTIPKFRPLGSSNNFFKITVNDLRLVPMPKNIRDEALRYRYKFYDDQTLTITCENHRNVSGNIVIETTDAQINANIEPDMGNEPWRKTVKLSTKGLNNKHLVCRNTNFGEISADIVFLEETNNPRIIGLISHDIIHQYTNSSTDWILDYWYNVNQTLNLDCVTKKPYYTVRWIAGDTLVDDIVGLEKLSHPFTFQAKHNGSRIVCEVVNGEDQARRGVVILHQKHLDSQNHDNFFKDHGILLIACSVVVTTTAITVLCLIFWCRVNRKTGTNKEAAYENLSNEPATPIPPYPSQWENVRVNVRNPEEVMIDNTLYNGGAPPIYAYPQKGRHTNSAIYHYIDVNDELKRKPENRNATADAAAKSNEPRSNTYNLTGSANSSAETNTYNSLSSARKNPQYNKFDTDNYASVIDRYEDVGVTEYAEPAYSECPLKPRQL